VFEGNGVVQDYVGGYEDWLRQRAQAPAAAPKTLAPAPGPAAAEPKRAVVKLSFKENKELTELPARIESLEAEQAALSARLADPAIYQGDGAALAAVRERLTAIETELAAAYVRWEALEARR